VQLKFLNSAEIPLSLSLQSPSRFCSLTGRVIVLLHEIGYLNFVKCMEIVTSRLSGKHPDIPNNVVTIQNAVFISDCCSNSYRVKGLSDNV
jgi:hypothetical protein